MKEIEEGLYAIHAEVKARKSGIGDSAEVGSDTHIIICKKKYLLVLGGQECNLLDSFGMMYCNSFDAVF